MRISQEADYAIRVVLYLSKAGYGTVVGAKKISEQEVISLRFLLKLLGKLAKCGIVQSFRGVNGGYALAKLPEDISLREVIEAVDGPIYMNRCLYDPALCTKRMGSSCEVHQVLGQINQALVRQLEQMNFGKIINKHS